ncbi:Disease resistance protein [Artemisia annua]|uniref:Disease resistance protein n=1 Tax=Artemisia annua TaxID=35608 RepID=A0A2U1NI29_ARTAN|nr:Disease resistance protein [Artemisia annua]
MADSLTSLINQSLDHLNDFSTYNPSSVEALDCKRLIAGSFDGLMSHLRKMMLGYENEEAHGLVKIIETICVEERQEIAVGFDEEVETLLDQLTGTSAKQLQIISIVRTPGLDEIYIMSDELLGEKLYRFLKDRQYLVIMDDIWDSKAWNELKIYYPDDNKGSRVIFTSRHKDVRKNVEGAKPAYILRLRNADESWEIFQKKIPGGVKLLRSSQSSLMIRDPSQYMDSLALSYNLLPRELQQCFLFLGVFPEDYDIPVTKLIWLWVAQGFIHETGSKSLEDAAIEVLRILDQSWMKHHIDK